MLKSAKDQVLGVKTPEQHVSPRVWYETTYLLIRDAMGSLPCSNEWKIGTVTHLGSHGARWAMVHCTTPRNLSIAMVPHSTLAKPGIRPIVNLRNDM
jgi:hypothetical protein